MKTKILIIAALACSLMANVVTILQNKNLRESIAQKVDEILPEKADESLSDWDIFTLALMKVESEYNNNAVSSVGAKGYFQMTPIYVKEVNRVHKTHFTFDQVTDFDKAYEIFDLMQKAHAYAKVVIPAMEEVRAIADQIEPLLGEEYKPFPSYEDLLYSVQ